jgi:simple sugar transport system permease protein
VSGAPEVRRVGARVRDVILGASARLTVLAFVAALGIGGVILGLSADATRRALERRGPGAAAGAALEAVGNAYLALLRGALGSRGALSETLVAATVLILTGLAVAVPLRAGLFNIGGEGQVIAGGMLGGWIGFSLTGLPTALHLPLAVLWAGLPVLGDW